MKKYEYPKKIIFAQNPNHVFVKIKNSTIFVEKSENNIEKNLIN